MAEETQETSDCLKQCMAVKVVWVSEQAQATRYKEVVSIDLGDATKEVMDKVVDYNTGWITLTHRWGKKTQIRASTVRSVESWAETEGQ